MHKTLWSAIAYIMIANAAHNGNSGFIQETDHVHVLRITAAAGEIPDMYHEIKFIRFSFLQNLFKRCKTLLCITDNSKRKSIFSLNAVLNFLYGFEIELHGGAAAQLIHPVVIKVFPEILPQLVAEE